VCQQVLGGEPAGDGYIRKYREMESSLGGHEGRIRTYADFTKCVRACATPLTRHGGGAHV
jgi:hypothetical protein